MATVSHPVLPVRRPRHALVVISVAAVLFLLGFFGLVLLQAGQLASAMKERIDLIVELQPETDSLTRATIGKRLEGSAFVKPGSVQFVSKADALLLMRKEFGEEVLRLDLPNPLYDIFTFNVPAAYLQPDSLAAIRTTLRESAGVADVYHQEGFVDEVALNLRRISWIMLVAAAVFTGLAVLLISGVIRLSLYANRFVIKTQELVGATWAFITRPYLSRAVRLGLWGGLLALAALALTQWWLEQQIPEMRDLRHPAAYVALAVALVVLGIGISWISTYLTVRKYLRLRVDDLY